jgi:hypothetical protein
LSRYVIIIIIIIIINIIRHHKRRQAEYGPHFASDPAAFKLLQVR